MVRHTRKRRHHSRRMRRGGYSDAASYMLDTVGNGNTQWSNVFMQGADNSNPSLTNSNAIRGLQGQIAGGKRRKSRASRGRRTKKGGFWSEVVRQAVVPFALLGLQQTYGRKKSHKKR